MEYDSCGPHHLAIGSRQCRRRMVPSVSRVARFFYVTPYVASPRPSRLATGPNPDPQILGAYSLLVDVTLISTSSRYCIALGVVAISVAIGSALLALHTAWAVLVRRTSDSPSMLVAGPATALATILYMRGAFSIPDAISSTLGEPRSNQCPM